MTRRMAMAGAATVMAAGALAVGSGPATAATTSTPEHHPAAEVPGGRDHSHDRHHAARQPTDPWIKDQLTTFYPSSTSRLAVFDPWVKDQLALFEKGT
ncbi:hypothetical protein C3489_00985 [Streptomyces sp. Ru71]|uniref:hypothetical protein n=1 Tax=Streptomyces sp. Ru71 TaxID=2080746 RepID=UPI000CDD704B|nr:hypothetical protein [Streptomyces sp. Ru71]POX57394.1 hypothetical protein C3489_00985 [Streptomyces sp. Ru71]